MSHENLELEQKSTPLKVAQRMFTGLVEELQYNAEIFFPHLEGWLVSLKQDKWMGIKAMLAVNAAVMVPTILHNWDVVEKLIQQ